MAHRHTVLVVHHDQDIREALEEMLKTHGLSVVAAANGHDALQGARTSPPPCAILLLEMPLTVGLNLRNAVGEIPIVVVSSDRSARAEAHAERRVDVLPTGEISRLMQVLRRHCYVR
ncbi:MAG TPA: response regulator [Candidatus Binatia bacterium]|jgi:DNA-binding response OmpR family regulator|nr:response regulator [Candidatus Binatia bacterium]